VWQSTDKFIQIVSSLILLFTASITWFTISVAYTARALREHTLCQEQNVNGKWSRILIRISRLIRIRMSTPKMLWIHCLVCISHYAKFCKNRAVTVWEMVRSILTCIVPQWWTRGQSNLTKSALLGWGLWRKIRNW